MAELNVDQFGRTIYELDGPTLERFMLSKSFVQVLLGPIGSGKSKACCLKCYKIAAEQKPGPDGIRRVRVAIVRNSYPLLRTTTVRTWLDTYPENIYGRLMWTQPPRQVVRWGDIQLEADFIALDDDADVQKLRSGEFTFFWINEIQYMPKILFDEMTSRVGRFPAVKDGGASWRGIIADGNVPDPDHWLGYALGLSPFPEAMLDDEKAALTWPSSWDFFMQPPGLTEVRDSGGTVVAYDENPQAENQKWLPEDYYIRLVANKSPAWIKSRILNQVSLVTDGAPVWPAFRPEVHVARNALQPVPGHEIWIGADFGRSPAVVFAQAVNNRVSILEEMQGHNESAVTFAPRVKRFLETHFRGFRFCAFGDPKGRDKTQSDERTAYDVFRFNGIDMRASPVKQNLIETRIAAVDSILNQLHDGRPRLQVSPACRTLIAGLSGGYCYERKIHSSEVKTEPAKNRFSHLCDSLQYVLLAMGEGRSMMGLAPLDELKPKQIYPGHRSMRRVMA